MGAPLEIPDDLGTPIVPSDAGQTQEVVVPLSPNGLGWVAADEPRALRETRRASIQRGEISIGNLEVDTYLDIAEVVDELSRKAGFAISVGLSGGVTRTPADIEAQELAQKLGDSLAMRAYGVHLEELDRAPSQRELAAVLTETTRLLGEAGVDIDPGLILPPKDPYQPVEAFIPPSQRERLSSELREELLEALWKGLGVSLADFSSSSGPGTTPADWERRFQVVWFGKEGRGSRVSSGAVEKLRALPIEAQLDKVHLPVSKLLPEAQSLRDQLRTIRADQLSREVGRRMEAGTSREAMLWGLEDNECVRILSQRLSRLDVRRLAYHLGFDLEPDSPPRTLVEIVLCAIEHGYWRALLDKVILINPIVGVHIGELPQVEVSLAPELRERALMSETLSLSLNMEILEGYARETLGVTLPSKSKRDAVEQLLREATQRQELESIRILVNELNSIPSLSAEQSLRISKSARKIAPELWLPFASAIADPTSVLSPRLLPRDEMSFECFVMHHMGLSENRSELLQMLEMLAALSQDWVEGVPFRPEYLSAGIQGLRELDRALCREAQARGHTRLSSFLDVEGEALPVVELRKHLGDLVGGNRDSLRFEISFDGSAAEGWTVVVRDGDEALLELFWDNEHRVASGKALTHLPAVQRVPKGAKYPSDVAQLVGALEQWTVDAAEQTGRIRQLPSTLGALQTRYPHEPLRFEQLVELGRSLTPNLGDVEDVRARLKQAEDATLAEGLLGTEFWWRNMGPEPIARLVSALAELTNKPVKEVIQILLADPEFEGDRLDGPFTHFMHARARALTESFGPATQDYEIRTRRWWSSGRFFLANPQ